MNDPTILTDLRDLLTSLPGWDDDELRRPFAEQALGKGHRVLGETTWRGTPRDVAWSLVSAAEDWDGVPALPAPGLSPLCALLAEARARYGAHPEHAPRITALQARLGCPGAEPPVDWELPPYPGMAAFDFEQAPVFFGRADETRALLRKLAAPRGQRLLLIAGRSGAGKSSLMRAGLWAALAGADERPLAGEGLAPLAGCERWAITPMKPAERGHDPFASLVDGIRVAGLRGLRSLDVDAEARVA